MSAAQLASGASNKTADMKRVGFIGLDHTGTAMATSLFRAGHLVTVYDPARDIPEGLASTGVNAANCLEDACRSADVVFTMLPDDEITEAVILGRAGVVESLPRKAIHIGSSTVSIECSDRIVEAHWNAGKQYISAPVLVRSGLTADEQLFVIAGGREATMIKIEPLLSQIGQLAQLSGWPSDANFVQLGADSAGASLFQFLARHPELRARQYRSQFGGPTSPLGRFLDIETKGVPQ